MDGLKEVVQYCAAHIVDWDEKCQLALTCIGNRMTIPNWFRNEIEDAVYEWCDEHEEVDAGEIDIEDIVLWEE